MRDPYDILGVSKSASADEIKKAYRKLAKQLHPDTHPGDRKVADRFKEVTAAYDLLGDADKRARFDRGEIDAQGNERPAFHRRQHAHAGAGGPGGDSFFGFNFGGGRGGGMSEEDAEDIFSQMFGRGARRNAQVKGGDRRYTMRVAFLDAVRGAKRRLTLPDGRALDVTIPAGIGDGQTIRLRGQGEQSPFSGPAGDALIEVEIEPHALFTRQGDDIHIDLPITLAEAVLGGKIEVPTIDGPVSMSVPRGSNSGHTLRLKGKGVPRDRGRVRGDQFVHLVVSLPDGTDPELERFAAEWGRKRPYDPRAKLPR
jgi:DnaJ-class molecular chaperone